MISLPPTRPDRLPLPSDAGSLTRCAKTTGRPPGADTAEVIPLAAKGQQTKAKLSLKFFIKDNEDGDSSDRLPRHGRFPKESRYEDRSADPEPPPGVIARRIAGFQPLSRAQSPLFARHEPVYRAFSGVNLPSRAWTAQLSEKPALSGD